MVGKTCEVKTVANQYSMFMNKVELIKNKLADKDQVRIIVRDAL